MSHHLKTVLWAQRWRDNPTFNTQQADWAVLNQILAWGIERMRTEAKKIGVATHGCKHVILERLYIEMVNRKAMAIAQRARSMLTPMQILQSSLQNTPSYHTSTIHRNHPLTSRHGSHANTTSTSLTYQAAQHSQSSISNSVSTCGSSDSTSKCDRKRPRVTAQISNENAPIAKRRKRASVSTKSDDHDTNMSVKSLKTAEQSIRARNEYLQKLLAARDIEFSDVVKRLHTSEAQLLHVTATLDAGKNRVKRLQTENEALRANVIKLKELQKTQASVADQCERHQNEIETLKKKLELSEVGSKECKAQMKKMEAQLAKAQTNEAGMRRFHETIRDLYNGVDCEPNGHCDSMVEGGKGQYGALSAERDKYKKWNHDLQKKLRKMRAVKDVLENKLLDARQCIDFFQSIMFDVRDRRVTDGGGDVHVHERLVQFDEAWIPLKYLPALQENDDTEDSDIDGHSMNHNEQP